MRAHRTPAEDLILAARADQYADKGADGADETLQIPEDVSGLDDTQLNELHSRAREVFGGIYGDGSDLTDEDVDTLAALTTGIEALQEELAVREQRAAERRERAAELAAKVQPAEDADEDENGEDDPAESEDAEGQDKDGEETEGDAEEAPAEEESAAETLTASAPRKRGPINVNVSRAKRHLPKSRQNDGAPKSMADIAFAAGEGSGYAAGEGIDWNDAGKIVDRRLAGINRTAVEAAARAGRHVRQQMGVMSIRKAIPDNLVIGNNDPTHVETVLRAAADEKRLQGNSLVASGGWCAPSEVTYDLLELESRDGIFSLPEVGLARGGISRTLGPSFADIYADIVGFHYTEAQDIAGQYGVDANGNGNNTAGSKPCYKIECPEFEEFRLELDGLCITAGLLQQKGYPEVIARTVRGALIAHDHRLARRTLDAIEAGSTAVTMPMDALGADGTTPAAAGAAAPLLAAIELQVEHVRYTQRISRSATMEAVFPFWVRGAIRADLSRRNGVELLSVTDAQINAWFSARGIAPQFVYNWQDINTIAAASFTGWPSQVRFLLYPAGSWVRGSSDVITVDTLVDSNLLGTNDFTALFTEEGWAVIPMGHDSRVVTVPICADGATAAGIEIACNSTTLAAGE